MRLVAGSLLLALATAPASAEVAIRVSGGRVELTATAAPLADVLDRLARQTGMKLVYEGPAPRQLVTVSLHGRTPAETVLAVFEGLGLNYALVADASGGGVQTLMVAGASSATAAPTAPAAARSGFGGNRRPFGPPPGSSPESVDPAFDQGEEEGDANDVDFAGIPDGEEGADAAEAEQAQGGAPPNMPANVPPQIPGAQPQGEPQAPPAQAAPPPQAPPPATTPFSASPFTPQPQPFPPVPPGVPPAGANPAPPGQENKPQAPPPQ